MKHIDVYGSSRTNMKKETSESQETTKDLPVKVGSESDARESEKSLESRLLSLADS